MRNKKTAEKIDKNKAIFWDYDIKKMDLNDPEVMVWYLNRKLQFGDLSGLKKSDLKKYFSRLYIDSSLKELLKNYLKQHAGS